MSAGILLAGCAASAPSLITPPTGALAPKAVSLAVLGNETLLAIGNSPTIDVSSTELYTRVAGGALKCWFGAGGPLKASHVFNAEVAPVASGGAAEIIVHERDPRATGQAASRGVRAFRISIEPISAEKARLSMTSGKLAPDLAAALEKDALAYAFGQDSCEAQVVRPPPPPTVAKKKPGRVRPALRTTMR
jgi:hypothetical protein